MAELEVQARSQVSYTDLSYNALVARQMRAISDLVDQFKQEMTALLSEQEQERMVAKRRFLSIPEGMIDALPKALAAEKAKPSDLLATAEEDFAYLFDMILVGPMMT